jgi:type III restriction enzyme
MSNRKQRLELTWIGKDQRPRLEPRILPEDEEKTGMLICEVKARNELEDATVKAKAAAATKWCKTATQHAGGSRPWRYLLDHQITGSATLDGLAAKFVTS